jgi:small subunit ribosomal protein S13
MVHFFESKLPERSSIYFALTKIYGLNRSTSVSICKKLGFSVNFKVKNLSQDQINDMFKIIENSELLLTQDLKKSKLSNFKAAVNIQSYKGKRKTKGLPVRGQRTHTNARTAKKKRMY